MKNKLILVLVVGLLCGPMVAQAIPIIFTAQLSGANENPANASLGIGAATVTVDTALVTMQVQVSFSGLTVPVSAAHIHCCVAAPGNAGVATATPTFPGFPAATTGLYDQVFDMTQAASYNAPFIAANGGTPAGAFAALLAGLNAGTAYLNIHTPVFPGGEIRGFLRPASVPEPGTLALLGLGLAGLGFGLRRRTT